jgi:hypothetical protein
MLTLRNPTAVRELFPVEMPEDQEQPDAEAAEMPQQQPPDEAEDAAPLEHPLPGTSTATRASRISARLAGRTGGCTRPRIYRYDERWYR